MNDESSPKHTKHGDILRKLLSTHFREFGLSGKEIEELSSKLNISRSSIESAIYKAKGGLDTFSAIFCEINKVKDSELESSISNFLEHSLSKKPPKSYLMWQKIASKLTENKRIYWLSLLDAAIEADRKFRAK
jgi:hypothetical protein